MKTPACILALSLVASAAAPAFAQDDDDAIVDYGDAPDAAGPPPAEAAPPPAEPAPPPAAAARPAPSAQPLPPPDAPRERDTNRTYDQGYDAGEMLADRSYDTGIWPLLGFVSGCFGPPWCLLVPGLACVSGVDAPFAGGGTPEYQAGFAKGYQDEAESSKTWSTLWWTVGGFAVVVGGSFVIGGISAIGVLAVGAGGGGFAQPPGSAPPFPVLPLPLPAPAE